MAQNMFDILSRINIVDWPRPQNIACDKSQRKGDGIQHFDQKKVTAWIARKQKSRWWITSMRIGMTQIQQMDRRQIPHSMIRYRDVRSDIGASFIGKE